MSSAEQLTGTVEHVTFCNEDSGFAVIEVGSDGELITAVGTMPGVAEGEEVDLSGEFTNHPSFGPQFKVSAFSCRLPTNTAAVLRYLASGALPGIGPVLARRIVEKFGSRTLSVLENDPDGIAKVRGMTPSRAAAAAEAFRRTFGVREAVAGFAQMGLPADTAIAAYRELGPEALDLVNENPFILCREPLSLPFERADSIAAELSFEKTADIRLRAGISYILSHNENNGHTCLPEGKLLPTAANYLDVPEEQLHGVLEQGIGDGLFSQLETPSGRFIFQPPLLRAEIFSAGRLRSLAAAPSGAADDPEKRLSDLENSGGIRYAPLQKTAILTALSSSCMVLTGGPGTGKTTAINAMISLFEQQADRVELTAPTGRAAKRMSEVCRRDAQTIHRLLEVDHRGAQDTMRFIHNEANPLRCDVVIVDEMSMVDSRLFESLLRALKPACRLILVGDSDQLPSVGAGNVLRDIIDSGIVPVVRLSEIFRQAAESKIVRTAHRISTGELPEPNEPSGDCFFMPADPQACQDLVCDLVARRLPKSYGFDPIADIQVLCPSKLGLTGTAALNIRLQALLNPPAPGRGQISSRGTVYREGDKVMQIKNDYDLVFEKDDGGEGAGVFNGDLGIIESVDARDGSLVVRADDRRVTYSGESLRELEIAYAITVHKSQGSEFGAVVLPVSADVPRRLCYRNLLYTAVTRAKKLLVMAGSGDTLAAMVRNDRKSLRYTCLKQLLRDGSLC